MFYVTDLADTNWSIVLLTNKKLDRDIEHQIDENANVEDAPFIGTSNSVLGASITIEEDMYTRNDHDDGLWFNTKGKRKRKRSS